MPKSKEIISSSDSESVSDSEPKQKRKKAAEKKPSKVELKSKSSKTASAATSKEDNEQMLELGKMRYVSVTEFKGRKMVNIREYYDADGEMKPGRKGIALSVDQWMKLKGHMSKIDSALEEM